MYNRENLNNNASYAATGNIGSRSIKLKVFKKNATIV